MPDISSVLRTEDNKNLTVIWDVMSHPLVQIYQQFWRTYFLHLQHWSSGSNTFLQNIGNFSSGIQSAKSQKSLLFRVTTSEYETSCNVPFVTYLFLVADKVATNMSKKDINNKIMSECSILEGTYTNQPSGGRGLLTVSWFPYGLLMKQNNSKYLSEYILVIKLTCLCKKYKQYNRSCTTHTMKFIKLLCA
jgi:hypothetical protein